MIELIKQVSGLLREGIQKSEFAVCQEKQSLSLLCEIYQPVIPDSKPKPRGGCPRAPKSYCQLLLPLEVASLGL